jgi:hypothetical protein
MSAYNVTDTRWFGFGQNEAGVGTFAHSPRLWRNASRRGEQAKDSLTKRKVALLICVHHPQTKPGPATTTPHPQGRAWFHLLSADRDYAGELQVDSLQQRLWSRRLASRSSFTFGRDCFYLSH